MVNNLQISGYYIKPDIETAKYWQKGHLDQKNCNLELSGIFKVDETGPYGPLARQRLEILQVSGQLIAIEMTVADVGAIIWAIALIEKFELSNYDGNEKVEKVIFRIAKIDQVS
jgi:hypothetical protein